MKTSRIIFVTLFITALSLVYVWQQTKIIEFAYEKQKKIKLCRQLLDRNMFLRYNLITLESSGNLSKNLKAFEADYEMPAFTQIVDLRTSQEKGNLELASGRRQDSRINLNKEKIKENILLSLFSPKSQAEAQTK